MKLELKHLAPYLPYGLLIKAHENIMSMDALSDYDQILHYGNDFIKYDYHISEVKPLLRPLSSITIEEAYELGVIITSEADMEDMEVGVGGVDALSKITKDQKYYVPEQ